MTSLGGEDDAGMTRIRFSPDEPALGSAQEPAGDGETFARCRQYLVLVAWREKAYQGARDRHHVARLAPAEIEAQRPSVARSPGIVEMQHAGEHARVVAP